jgi:hypothetical protein
MLKAAAPTARWCGRQNLQNPKNILFKHRATSIKQQHPGKGMLY